MGSAKADYGDLPAPYKEDWGGLFGELRALVAEERFKDWVFAFGTAAGAAFECSRGMIIVNYDGVMENPLPDEMGGALFRFPHIRDSEGKKSA